MYTVKLIWLIWWDCDFLQLWVKLQVQVRDVRHEILHLNINILIDLVGGVFNLYV